MPRRGRHRALDLEADRLAEAAPAKLLLDGQEEVVRLVLLDRQVGVASDPEQVRLEDLHAAEQEVEVGLDDLVEQHEGQRRDLDEAGQDLGHLDPGEPALAVLRVAHPDRDREAERADVRERVPGIDREGRQDREDLVDEALAQALVMVGDLAVVEDRDALFGQLVAELGEDRRVVADRAPGPGSGSRPAVGRRAAVREVAVEPAATCWRSPATRTWKNSSSMLAKIDRNLTRSRGGLRSSRASWRTRAS